MTGCDKEKKGFQCKVFSLGHAIIRPSGTDE